MYPGSPFIIQRLLRERDRLRLFELHPTDAKTLRANVAQLEAGRLVTVMQEDGFEGLKKFLPPPSRRALVLCYRNEMKTDYARVLDMMTDALKRFATGTYLVGTRSSRAQKHMNCPASSKHWSIARVAPGSTPHSRSRPAN